MGGRGAGGGPAGPSRGTGGPGGACLTAGVGPVSSGSPLTSAFADQSVSSSPAARLPRRAGSFGDSTTGGMGVAGATDLASGPAPTARSGWTNRGTSTRRPGADSRRPDRVPAALVQLGSPEGGDPRSGRVSAPGSRHLARPATPPRWPNACTSAIDGALRLDESRQFDGGVPGLTSAAGPSAGCVGSAGFAGRRRSSVGPGVSARSSSPGTAGDTSSVAERDTSGASSRSVRAMRSSVGKGVAGSGAGIGGLTAPGWTLMRWPERGRRGPSRSP